MSNYVNFSNPAASYRISEKPSLISPRRYIHHCSIAHIDIATNSGSDNQGVFYGVWLTNPTFFENFKTMYNIKLS